MAKNVLERYQFPEIAEPTQEEVLLRQGALCAACGSSLLEGICQMHFILPPYSVQVDAELRDYLVSEGNLVGLCGYCFEQHGGGRSEIMLYFKDQSGKIIEQRFAIALGDARYRLAEKVISKPELSVGDILRANLEDLSDGEQSRGRIFVFDSVEQ